VNWAEERRANRAAEAEQARQDADAALARRMRQQAARAEQRRVDEAAAATRVAEQRATRKAARAAALARTAGWLSENRVRLPIYLLALVSAAMAVPAMAAYGEGTYGDATGAALPALSELGMWAFALAVEVSRHRHPNRPVWSLQVGTWLFAGIGFALNVLHGLHRGWDAAAVMGIVSVAGVVAHQLAVASPRRSAVERAEARIDRRAHRKVARVRAAAVRHAVAEIDADGTARLVFAPGRYVLTGRGLIGRRLEAAIEPAAHVGEVLADEVAVWLATQDRPVDPVDDTPIVDAPVLTLDRPDDQRKSTRKRATHPAPKTRTIGQLRTEFAAALADPTVSIDPTKAESIRTALRCAPKTARQLRDEYQADHQ
jgi:hypothetical protein